MCVQMHVYVIWPLHRGFPSIRCTQLSPVVEPTRPNPPHLPHHPCDMMLDVTGGAYAVGSWPHGPYSIPIPHAGLLPRHQCPTIGVGVGDGCVFHRR